MSEATFQAQLKTHSLIYFWRGEAARTGRFNTFSQPKLPRAKKKPLFLREGGPNYTRFGENIELHQYFSNLFTISDIILRFGSRSPRVASWCCGRASDSRSRGRGFESQPGTTA